MNYSLYQQQMFQNTLQQQQQGVQQYAATPTTIYSAGSSQLTPRDVANNQFGLKLVSPRDNNNMGVANYNIHRIAKLEENQLMAQRLDMEHNKMSKKASDDLNPDSNIYVANLPSNYGRDNLHSLFSAYGDILRYKFSQPEDANAPGYGFVQFTKVDDAKVAIEKLKGTVFESGEKIYMSIALRRRSSLSEEPTNLYIKNVPFSWDNDRLRETFSTYGNIRQSKVMGDGIAFVRFENHEEALVAINNLDKKEYNGKNLEVRFANRKTAVAAYKAGLVPTAKSNQNNLYVRNLPKGFLQSDLEELFSQFGKISSGKINENGVAFVRYAENGAAEKAIKNLNGTRPAGYNFEQDIVVKFAHYDIGDARNRWRVNYHSHGSFNNHLVSQNPPVPYHNMALNNNLNNIPTGNNIGLQNNNNLFNNSRNSATSHLVDTNNPGLYSNLLSQNMVSSPTSPYGLQNIQNIQSNLNVDTNKFPTIVGSPQNVDLRKSYTIQEQLEKQKTYNRVKDQLTQYTYTPSALPNSPNVNQLGQNVTLPTTKKANNQFNHNYTLPSMPQYTSLPNNNGTFTPPALQPNQPNGLLFPNTQTQNNNMVNQLNNQLNRLNMDSSVANIINKNTQNDLTVLFNKSVNANANQITSINDLKKTNSTTTPKTTDKNKDTNSTNPKAEAIIMEKASQKYSPEQAAEITQMLLRFGDKVNLFINDPVHLNEKIEYAHSFLHKHDATKKPTTTSKINTDQLKISITPINRTNNQNSALANILNTPPSVQQLNMINNSVQFDIKKYQNALSGYSTLINQNNNNVQCQQQQTQQMQNNYQNQQNTPNAGGNNINFNTPNLYSSNLSNRSASPAVIPKSK